MKKIFFGFIMSLMWLFIVWVLVAYVKYDGSIDHLHLDIKSFVRSFDGTFSNTLKNYYTSLTDYIDSYLDKMKITTLDNIQKLIDSSTTLQSNDFLGWDAVLKVLKYIVKALFAIINFAMSGFRLILWAFSEVAFAVDVIVNVIKTLLNPVFI